MLSAWRKSDRVIGVLAGSTAIFGIAVSAPWEAQEASAEASHSSAHNFRHLIGGGWKLPTTYCEPTVATTDAPYPSWTRRTLASLWLASLPLPRVILPNDPDLTLSQRHRRERQQCDLDMYDLQVEIRQAIQLPGEETQRAVGNLLKRSYEILYGPNLGPQDRQNFLQQYGCTGWTEAGLVTLLELGASRGFVEIAAGNGQWARILNDRYLESEYYAQQLKRGKFEFCLAYDNMSALPLNPEVYHKRTKPYHDYFYDNVQNVDSISDVLKQWQCRSRVLLLVYPSPDSGMAVEAIQAYAEISPLNDTVVYVGEGRGGANANDAFFDYLENGEWILWQILPVRVFGTKGFEQLYIFKRRKSNGEFILPVTRCRSVLVGCSSFSFGSLFTRF
jgi:hypothetical protein